MIGQPELHSGSADRPPPDSLRSLIGGGTIYAAGRAVQLAAAILVLPLLTRLLTANEYGEVAAALVVIQLLTVLAAAGLPVAITMEFFRGSEGPRRAQTLMIWTGLVGVIITLTAELLAPYWSHIFGGVEHLSAMRVAVVAVTPLVFLSAVQSLLQVQERPKQYAIITIAGTAGAQVIGLLFVIAFDASARTYLVGVVVGGSIAAGAGWLLTHSNLGAWRDWSIPRWGLRNGLPTVPHDLAIYVIFAGDRVILQRAEGFATVGRYQIAYIAGTLGITLVSAMNSAWLPIIFGAADNVRWKLVADTTISLYWLAAVVAGALALASPIMLSLLAPSTFGPFELAEIASIVALSVLPYVTVASNVLVLLHLGKSSYLTWATPLCAVFNIAMNILLVPRFGMTAAAMLTVATYCAQATVLKLITRSLVDIPWRWRSTAASWLLGTLLVLLGIMAPTAPGWLVGRGVASATLLLALASAVTWRFRRRETTPVSPAV